MKHPSQPLEDKESQAQPCEDSRPFAGLRIRVRDLPESCDTAPTDGQNAEICLLVMCTNGELRVSLAGLDGEKELCLSPGNCLLHFAPDSCACERCYRGQRAQFLEISCSAVTLQELVGDTELGRELREAMARNRPLHIHRPMTGALHQALTSLRETMAKGPQGAGPLVIARALETIWHFTHSGGQDVGALLAPDTLRAVEKAKAILESRMDSPPDLESLAALVGMSLSKLKQVFPLACGMPPFAYLRVLRMERAMRLLREEGRSVTEAALEVGYSNLSHFSKTFAEHFGVKPSQAKASDAGRADLPRERPPGFHR